MDILDATDTRTRITNLLAWSHTRGIRIDPRLHIIPGTSADSSHSAGITVVSREAIPPDTTLVHIPSSAVLSTRSSPLAAHIPHDDALQSQQLGLALALHYELLRGAASPWAPYLASLPRAPVPIALFWGDRDAASYTGHANTNTGNGDINDKEKAEVDLRLQDGLAAAAWLAGTEVEREVLRTPVAEIRAYYIHTAQPLLARRAGAGTGAGTLGAFYHAYALVSSRAFIVDAYHGLAMVPIADACVPSLPLMSYIISCLVSVSCAWSCAICQSLSASAIFPARGPGPADPASLHP
ncbi:SET domain-containing protein [Athelia psychrophila]|uniref:SET domain-containing protein n=1 Tax=Athelia psychrophila TaxID=1759441 RepID=A0A166Q193_9AGAM|nr:SET domain-containing protein [Fibularhizoctonia sp. CBS 109695]